MESRGEGIKTIDAVGEKVLGQTNLDRWYKSCIEGAIIGGFLTKFWQLPHNVGANNRLTWWGGPLHPESLAMVWDRRINQNGKQICLKSPWLSFGSSRSSILFYRHKKKSQRTPKQTNYPLPTAFTKPTYSQWK